MIEDILGVIFGLFIMLSFLMIPLFIFALVVGGFAFWTWMLVSAIKNSKLKDNEKIVWVLVIVLVGIIGALIYYFVVHRK